jgi:hypothetical protein
MIICAWKPKATTFLGFEGKSAVFFAVWKLADKNTKACRCLETGKTDQLHTNFGSVRLARSMYNFGLVSGVTTWNQVKVTVSCVACAHTDATTEISSSAFAFWFCFLPHLSFNMESWKKAFSIKFYFCLLIGYFQKIYIFQSNIIR